MGIFKLQTYSDITNKYNDFLYDNMKHKLYTMDNHIVKLDTNPVNPIRNEYVIRILLGRKCNLKCKFCIQCDVPEIEKDANMSNEQLVKHILKITKNKPTLMIHFTGGEPFIYLEKMKKYVKLFNRFNNDNRKIIFSATTNGTMFEKIEVCKWTEKYIDSLIISYDGIGNELREYNDIIINPSINTFIKKFLSLNKEIKFNMVITKDNYNIEPYNDYLLKHLYPYTNFILYPCRLITPINDYSTDLLLSDNKLTDYINTNRKIIFNYKIPQWTFPYKNINTLEYSYKNNIKIATYCQTYNPNFLILDENGLIHRCKNTSEPHLYTSSEYDMLFNRNIIDFDNINEALEIGFIQPEFNIKYIKSKCENCFIYASCFNICHKVPTYNKELNCKNRFAEVLPYYIHLIKTLTNEYLQSIERIK